MRYFTFQRSSSRVPKSPGLLFPAALAVLLAVQAGCSHRACQHENCPYGTRYAGHVRQDVSTTPTPAARTFQDGVLAGREYARTHGLTHPLAGNQPLPQSLTGADHERAFEAGCRQGVNTWVIRKRHATENYQPRDQPPATTAKENRAPATRTPRAESAPTAVVNPPPQKILEPESTRPAATRQNRFATAGAGETGKPVATTTEPAELPSAGELSGEEDLAGAAREPALDSNESRSTSESDLIRLEQLFVDSQALTAPEPEVDWQEAQTDPGETEPAEQPEERSAGTLDAAESGSRARGWPITSSPTAGSANESANERLPDLTITPRDFPKNSLRPRSTTPPPVARQPEMPTLVEDAFVEEVPVEEPRTPEIVDDRPRTDDWLIDDVDVPELLPKSTVPDEQPEQAEPESCPANESVTSVSGTRQVVLSATYVPFRRQNNSQGLIESDMATLQERISAGSGGTTRLIAVPGYRINNRVPQFQAPAEKKPVGGSQPVTRRPGHVRVDGLDSQKIEWNPLATPRPLAAEGEIEREKSNNFFVAPRTDRDVSSVGTPLEKMIESRFRNVPTRN